MSNYRDLSRGASMSRKRPTTVLRVARRFRGGYSILARGPLILWFTCFKSMASGNPLRKCDQIHNPQPFA
jgi:hypothetical protein